MAIRSLLVVLRGDFGVDNLLVVAADGAILARLGTTCGTGVIDQVLAVGDELRAIEVTLRGDYQARLDLDSLTLKRVAEWR